MNTAGLILGLLLAALAVSALAAPVLELLVLAWTAIANGARGVLYGRRPQAGDKPVQIEATFDGVVSLADVVAHLTATGSTVAAEFVPVRDRVDTADGMLARLKELAALPSPTAAEVALAHKLRDAIVALHRDTERQFTTGGILAVPDDVAPLPADLTATDPLILRTSRPGAVRRLEHRTKAALAREAARVRRDAYDQLLRDRAGRRDAAVPVQADVPRPTPRPSPGRASRH